MTPQQVIKNFMAKLVDHGYSYSASIGTAMLDYGVKGSSDFSNVQAVIDAMKADQKQAEKEAVEEVLGSSYAGKTLSEVSESILNADAKNYDTNNIGNAYYNQSNDRRTTVERLIKERKAIIFLEKYCGIQLANKYWINSSDNITYWSGKTTGNVDTGAITGSDANVTLTAGEVLGGKTLSAQDLQVLKTNYGTAASLSSDGQSIVIGTGVEKTDRSVVPEIGNKYTATTSAPQNINTGSNDWIVVATSGNDTITTGGADSVNAGAGNDKIYVGGDYASILTGAGSDSVEISAEVKNVTIGDLNSSDILKISGTFEVGSAKIEDTVLVITDKSGSRKIRLGDFDNAKNAKINSTTIANWLTNAGINLNNLQMTGSNNDIDLGNPKVTSSSNDSPISSTTGGEGQIAIDPDYTPTPIYSPPDDEVSDVVHRSSNSTGEINVNLDNVTLTGGNLNLDGNKVGEISNEFPHITSFTKNGLTINLVGTTTNNDGYPSNFENKTFDQLTDSQKTIVAGLFKWWGKECLQVNEESYGISFNSSTAQVKEIGLYFYDGNGSSNTLATVWNWSTAGTGQNTTKLMLNINMDYYNGIAEDNLDGQSSKSSAGLLDRTLAHEFTHALMATNLHYFNSLPKFIKEGMAELTHGIDDFRPTNIFKIAYDDDWLDASLDLGNKGTGSQNIGDGYSGGYMFLRYFAKQAALQSIVDELSSSVNPLLITLTENADTYSNSLASATIMALAGNDSIYNTNESVSIDAGAGNDTIHNNWTGWDPSSMYVTINAGDGEDIIQDGGAYGFIDLGAGNDSIHSWNNFNTINGGDGNDTINSYNGWSSINGGAGDDFIILTQENHSRQYSTIKGSTGNDTIYSTSDTNLLYQYTLGDGNDSIVGLNAISTLQIGNGTTDTYSKSTVGSDILVSVGSGVITLSGAASLSTVNILGKEVIETIPAGVTINNATNSTLITSGAGNDSIFNRGRNVTINSANSADTVDNWGHYAKVDAGAGDDSISNRGNHVILNTGTGNDNITNFYAVQESINVGDGNDYMLLYGTSYSTFDAGAGNDTIENVYGSNFNRYNGGAGDDYISTANSIHVVSWGGASNTINGGGGNDTIFIGSATAAKAVGTIIEYGDGDGDDVITALYDNSYKIKLTSGTLKETVNNGSDIILKIGTGSITLQNAANSHNINVSGNTINVDAKSVTEQPSVISATQATVISAETRRTRMLINGSPYDDKIYNYNDENTLNGGAGDDWIWLTGGHRSQLNGGNGNDSININSGGQQNTVNAGAGNDSIYSGGDENVLSGGDGNDIIRTWGEDSTIYGGKGDDTVDLEHGSNYGAYNSFINYTSGDGNDIVYGFDTTSTLKIGNGTTDTYSKSIVDSNILVSVGSGVVTLQGAASLSKVNILGKEVSTNPLLITLTENADTYSNSLANATILALAGNDKITNSGAKAVINLGEGADSIYNTADSVSIDGGNGNDSIYSYGWLVSVSGGAGNDTITGTYISCPVRINGDAGDDYINNAISSYGTFKDATIDGGTGNDTINAGKGLVLGGEGNDSISIHGGGTETTVIGGTGNDTILCNEQDTQRSLIKYTSGDGNDLVKGFKTNDTLQIGNGTTDTFSSIKSGNDIVISVGTGNVTLTGAGSLSTVNVAGKYVQSGGKWEFGDGYVSYIVNAEILFTIYRISSAAKESDFNLNGTNVTIAKNALGEDDVFLEGEGYTLKLASDVPQSPVVTAPYWSSLVNGKATYTRESKTAYYTIEDNTVIYTPAEGGEIFTLSGVKSISSTAVNVDDENKIVTLFAPALGTDKITLDSEYYSLTLDKAITQDPGVSERKFISLANSVATYKIFGDKAYYELEGNEVFYISATADKQFTISGLASNLTLSNGKIDGVSAVVNEEAKSVKFTLSAKALKDSDVTLTGSGATLELGNDVLKTAQNIPTAWSEVVNGTASYNTNGKSKYYTLSGSKVTYHAPVEGELQIKLAGLSTSATTVNGKISGLTVSGKSLTISAAAVGQNVALTHNNGFNISLASDVKNISFAGTSGIDSIANSGSNVSINGGAGSDYIFSGGAGYNKLIGGAGDDTIYESTFNPDSETTLYSYDSYIDAGDGNDSILSDFAQEITVLGGAGNDTIDIANGGGKGSSINAGSGNDVIFNKVVEKSSFSAITTLNGGEGNDSIQNNGSNASISGGAGNDSISNNATNNVTINTAQGNDTIKLGSATESFKVESFSAGDVIDLATSVTKLETISGGIKAGSVSISGVTGIATVNNSWSTSTNSIAYNQSTVAGAKVSGTKITYDTSSGTENLFTISGIKSTVGVSLSDKEITLSNAALNGVTGTVSISGGDYKLKLASDVDTIAENVSDWTTLTSGNVAYLEGGKGSYYALSNDGKSVTYNAAVAGTNKVEFSGVKGTPTLNGNTVSLTANNFNSNVNVVSNAGNYQFALSGAFDGKKFTGTAKADSIVNAGSNISIDAVAGNDNIQNSGSNVTITGGAGNDVFSYSKGNFKITDYTANADKISLDIAKVEDVTFNNNDVVLNLGQSDAITVEGGKDKKITVAKDKTAQYIFGDHVIFNSGKTSTTLTSAATNFDAVDYSAVVTVDATKANSATKITGNAKANKIFAGDNGSTLIGGKGNDSLYGGAGVDIFVYENQTDNDVIYNYTSKKDKISLGAGASFPKFSVDENGDVLLKIGSNNLKLKKADNENISENGKEITIIDATGNETTETYFTNRTVSGKGVTLNADYVNSFTADSGIVTVDATQSTNPLILNGNNKNNILTGGTGNDSLLGGTGNDSLTGGDGKNVFIYKAGKDFITDYTAGQDKIQIAKGKISKTSLKGSNVVFTIGSGSLTVKDAKGKTISLLDSSNKASSTVVGAQTLTNSNKASVAIGTDMGVVNASSRTKAITIKGNALANTISGGSKNDALYGAAGNDSILGNAGNDKLYGDAGNDQIYGGKGNDSLWGDKGNDSLTGGDGKDVFIYKAGKDLITDYNASQDKIQIASGKISKTSFKGSNVVFTIGSGSLTVKDAKGKTISLIDSSNKVSSTVVGAQTLTNSNKASITIGTDMSVVNASSRTKAITIKGNALANTISGGSKNDTLYGAAGNDSILGNAGNDKLYGDAGNDILLGGKGNDSLWGGKGNDSLWGDAGADNFFYSRGDGKDVIFGFDNKDTLTLDNLDFKASYKNNAITFNVNGGSITLKNFTATTFHVNDDSYKISGSKFVKK